MKRHNSDSFTAVISLALAIISIVGCNVGSSEYQPIENPVDQKRKERVFVKIPTDAILQLGLDIPTFDPRKVQPFDSISVVLDASNLRLVVFDKEGHDILIVGNGVGNGPGELTSITNYGQTKSGDYWIFDGNAFRVSMFSKDGRFIRSFATDSDFENALLTDDNRLVVNSLFSDFAFATISSEGKVEESWSRLVENPMPDGMKFMGGMVWNVTSESFVLIPGNNGKLISYSTSGDLLYFRETVESMDAPSVIEDNGGGFVFDISSSPLSFQQFPMNVWEDELYVATYHHKDESIYVDAYVSDNGDYKYSFRIPRSWGCGPSALTDEVLFLRCNDRVEVRQRVDRFADTTSQ